MKETIGLGLTGFVLLFQIFLLTKFRPLYFVLEIFFFLGLATALIFLVRPMMQQKPLWLVLALGVLIRIPFYFHADGMLTTSFRLIR